jgi:hypothetical protein
MTKIEKYYRQHFMKHDFMPHFDTLLEGEKREMENTLNFALWSFRESVKDIFEKIKNLTK